jgi:osmotically-inducible protein OsmY
MTQHDRDFENRAFGRGEPFGRQERFGNQWREGREGGYGSGFDQPGQGSGYGYQGSYGQGGYGPGYGQAGYQSGYGQGGYGQQGRGQQSWGPERWSQQEEFGRGYMGSGQSGGFGQGHETMPGYGYGRGEQQREQYGSLGQQGHEGSWGSAGPAYGSGFATGTQFRGRHFGRGPKNYKRSDQRIEEEINEQLTRHPEVDASEIEVTVKNGEVTLSGTVDERRAKRLAEDIAEDCSGVREVRNNLRIQRQHEGATSGSQQAGSGQQGEPRARAGSRG